MLTPEQKIHRIAKALDKGGGLITVREVLDGLKTGQYQIFDNDGGVIITRICERNAIRYLECFIGAGEMQPVLALQQEMFDFAKAHDCQWIEMIGRLGWEKILPAHGWKKTHVVFVHEVEQ